MVLGGAPIASLQDGSIEIDNGFAEVVGLQGYLGGSKGPVMGTISAKRAVPRLGIPVGQDLHSAVIKQTFVQFCAVTGGKKYVVEGVPKTLHRSFGAASTAMEDIRVHGAISITDI